MRKNSPRNVRGCTDIVYSAAGRRTGIRADSLARRTAAPELFSDYFQTLTDAHIREEDQQISAAAAAAATVAAVSAAGYLLNRPVHVYAKQQSNAHLPRRGARLVSLDRQPSLLIPLDLPATLTEHHHYSGK